MRYSNSLSNSVSQPLWNRTDQNSLKVHRSRCISVFGSLADSVLYVAHPNVLVLFGGSVELVHLRRTGVSDEEHTSFVIGYVPHDEVLQREDWRFVLNAAAQTCWRKEKISRVSVSSASSSLRTKNIIIGDSTLSLTCFLTRHGKMYFWSFSWRHTRMSVISKTRASEGQQKENMLWVCLFVCLYVYWNMHTQRSERPFLSPRTGLNTWFGRLLQLRVELRCWGWGLKWELVLVQYLPLWQQAHFLQHVLARTPKNQTKLKTTTFVLFHPCWLWELEGLHVLQQQSHGVMEWWSDGRLRATAYYLGSDRDCQNVCVFQGVVYLSVLFLMFSTQESLHGPVCGAAALLTWRVDRPSLWSHTCSPSWPGSPAVDGFPPAPASGKEKKLFEWQHTLLSFPKNHNNIL